MSRLAWLIGGVVIGALAAGLLTFSRLDPSGFTRRFSAAEVTPPVLPEQIINSDENYSSTLMSGFQASYWMPMLDLIQTEFPGSKMLMAYRARELPVFNDDNPLFAEIDQAATAAGWTRAEHHSYRNVVYVMRSYEQSGHFFAVLVFTNQLSEIGRGLRIAYADDQTVTETGFLPVLVLTDLAPDRRGNRLPWINPDAPRLSYDEDGAHLTPLQ